MTGRYEEDFPYVSPCGPETNYVRCDDLPVVFTHLLDQHGQPIQDIESYGNFSLAEPSEEIDNNTLLDQSKLPPTLRNPSTSSGDIMTSSGSVPDAVHGRDPVGSEMLSYGGAGASLTVPFHPEKLCMLPEGGRVYHASPDVLEGVGLVKSSLAIELSRFFVYEDGANESCPPVGFRWRGKAWTLDGSTVETLEKMRTKSNDQ